jgi:hypothetical protein
MLRTFFEPANLGTRGQHANPYTTEAAHWRGYCIRTESLYLFWERCVGTGRSALLLIDVPYGCNVCQTKWALHY